MYLHTVGCCQTVNENTPPRLTPAMEIGAREQAHGKQWNEKWRRVRVKTNERAVLKWNEHKNTTSKSKSKNTTQQTDERKKKSAKQKQNIKHLHSAVAKQQRVAFLFFQCENFHIYTLHVHTNEIAAAPRISPLTICHFHFSPVFIRTHDFFPLLLLLVVIFFFLFFFSFSIYFCLAFCDVAFVCFFVLLVISSQNIDTTTLHVPHFDGAVIISMLGVDVVSCSSLTELFMTLSLFSHSSSPPSLSPSLSSAKLFSHVLEPMAKHDCKISKTHQYCMWKRKWKTKKASGNGENGWMGRKRVETKPLHWRETHIYVHIVQPTTTTTMYTKYSILNVLSVLRQSEACGNISNFCVSFFFIRSFSVSLFHSVFLFRRFSTFQRWKFVHSK